MSTMASTRLDLAGQGLSVFPMKEGHTLGRKATNKATARCIVIPRKETVAMLTRPYGVDPPVLPLGLGPSPDTAATGWETRMGRRKARVHMQSAVM